STDYSTRIQVLQERGAFPPPDASKNGPENFILPVSNCAAPPAPPGCLTALLDDPQVRALLIGANAAEAQALLDTFKYVDYLVSGAFFSPSFLNTDSVAPADQSYQIDERNSNARTTSEAITFLLAVPKERPEVGHLAPFPTVIAGHGYKSTRVEHILGFGGTFAKFGLATIAIDAYGHGIGIDPLLELTGRTLARKYGLDAFADAVFRGRARDLDYDGIKDSGGGFGKGAVNPGADLFAFGISLGGILTGILPAVEPAIVAAGPTSGAGGLADVGIRSTLDQVVQAVFLELFGPMFATCPFSASSGPVDPQTGIPFGECDGGASDAQPMLVLVVQDVNRERDVPVAQLTLQKGQRVMVQNLAQTNADCS